MIFMILLLSPKRMRDASVCLKKIILYFRQKTSEIILLKRGRGGKFRGEGEKTGLFGKYEQKKKKKDAKKCGAAKEPRLDRTCRIVVQ